MSEKQVLRREVKEIDNQELAGLHPVLRRIFLARGIASQSQLEKGLEKLIPYQLLFGIDRAAECLYQALQNQSRILIVGDFDADGATSCSVAMSALYALGAKHVDYIVPNRFEYGYGLTPEIVEVAKQRSPDLIVTVDNGISSCEGVAAAKQAGIQVIVTDHHLPGDELPQADAIVNPNLAECEFPSKSLAGVGVIFYLMLALRSHLRAEKWFEQQGIVEPNMAQFLDLVALGTVADVVSLDHNNRILVHQGLARMRQGKCRLGIKALLEVGKRRIEDLVASDLAFAVAPRLNAAGRLDDMTVGIECLLSHEESKAKQLAKQLDQLNVERRQIEAEMQQQAMLIVEQLQFANEGTTLQKAICLFDESWHQGVIGIVAGRIKERFYRPVIAFAKVSETEIKGSARSIPSLHIRDALDLVAKKHPEILTKFGGHAMAAGLSLHIDNYSRFVEVFEQQVDHLLKESDLQSIIHSDGELAEHDFSLDMAQLLRESGPWGQSFPEPLFDGEFSIVQQRLVGERHLKLLLAIPGSNSIIDAIAFGVDLAVWPNSQCQTVHAAYRLDVNQFAGQRNLQLVIEHLEAVE